MPGHAGESGTVAADLAAIGWTAARDILEAPLGFFQAGGGFDPKIIVDRLGNPWMFASPGDLIKRFPCGTIQQQVMDEMLRLIQQNDIKAADVEKVEVGGNLSNYKTLFQHHPTTGLQGKFSMEFAMAILLLERKATLSSFTDAVVQRAGRAGHDRPRALLRGPRIQQAGTAGRFAASHARRAKHPENLHEGRQSHFGPHGTRQRKSRKIP